jgi:hypothetical protein
VNIHGIFQLILESLDFGPLIEQFFFFEADFSFELVDAPDLAVDGEILIPQGGQSQLELCHIFALLLAVDVPLDEVGVG